ncbi:MAG: nucleotidyltransferase domain-containing protein [Thiotrichaceae bacterium]
MNTTFITIISEIIKRYPQVTLAIVFGSLATNTQHSNSDIDLAVQTDCPLDVALKKQIIEALALKLGRPVDLIDLNKAGQPLLGQILATGKRITGSDTRYARLITKNLLDRADFLPYRNRILEERRQAWIGM